VDSGCEHQAGIRVWRVGRFSLWGLAFRVGGCWFVVV